MDGSPKSKMARPQTHLIAKEVHFPIVLSIMWGRKVENNIQGIYKGNETPNRLFWCVSLKGHLPHSPNKQVRPPQQPFFFFFYKVKPCCSEE